MDFIIFHSLINIERMFEQPNANTVEEYLAPLKENVCEICASG